MFGFSRIDGSLLFILGPFTENSQFYLKGFESGPWRIFLSDDAPPLLYALSVMYIMNLWNTYSYCARGLRLYGLVDY